MQGKSAFFPQQQKASDGSEVVSTAIRQPAGASQISKNASGLLCGSVAAPTSSGQVGRGLRFPSSRRYLWDRTPAGPQILINTQDHLPHVQVAVSAFSAINRAAEHQAGNVPLQLGISVTPTNQVTVLVQELDPLVLKVGGGDLLQLTCPLAGTNEQQGSGLRAALQAQLDQRNSAHVQQLYALSASATPARMRSQAASLQLQLLAPSCSLLATPLYTKRLCHVPLAEALLKPGGMVAWQTGYLSMDQARSLLPLEATDTNVYSTPLVGVWVKGPSSVMHPLVAAACLRFSYCSLLADRAVQPDSGAFLLLLCPEGDPVSKCYEVCPSDLTCLHLSSYHFTATLSKGTSMAQHPGGLVKAECQVSQEQPEQLPGRCFVPSTQAASAAVTTLRRRDGNVNAGMLCLPQPAAVNDSPVLLLEHQQRRSYNSSKPVGVQPDARSSAPSVYAHQQQQQQQDIAATVAAARRSLPLINTGAATASTGLSSRSAGSSSIPSDVGVTDRDDVMLPQPRSSMPARPYGSPNISQQQYRQAAKTGQQHASQDTAAGVQEHQQWVQLGEQLLVEPSAHGSTQLIAAANKKQALQAPTAAAEARDQSDVQCLQQQQQQQLAPPGNGSNVGSVFAWDAMQLAAGAEITTSRQQQDGADTCTDADSAPRLGSPVKPYKQQQHFAAADAARLRASEDIEAVEHAGSNDSTVHEVCPECVSPSVRAGVALSNLALLQHLSTGQLQAAIEQVSSPSKSPQQQYPQQGQQQQYQGRVSVSSSGSSAGNTAGAAMCMELSLAGTGADQQYTEQYNSQQQCSNQQQQHWVQCNPAAAMALSVCYNGTAAGTNAAPMAACTPADYSSTGAASAALLAATAAVQRMPPSPYGRSLGMQRYATTAVALGDSRNSQEFAVSVAGAWASTALPHSPDTAAAASPGSHLSRGGVRWPSPGSGCYPASPCISHASDSVARQPHSQQLHSSLTASAAAVASTAAALEAAGEMLHPHNAPSSSMSQQQVLMQQQQQEAVFRSSCHDPVTQALRGEVAQLRQQLIKLQQQLQSAGLPDPATVEQQLQQAAAAAVVEATQVASVPDSQAVAATPGQGEQAAAAGTEAAPAVQFERKWRQQQQEHKLQQQHVQPHSSVHQDQVRVTGGSNSTDSQLQTHALPSKIAQHGTVVPGPQSEVSLLHQATAVSIPAGDHRSIRSSSNQAAPAAAGQATAISPPAAANATASGITSANVADDREAQHATCHAHLTTAQQQPGSCAVAAAESVASDADAKRTEQLHELASSALPHVRTKSGNSDGSTTDTGATAASAKPSSGTGSSTVERELDSGSKATARQTAEGGGDDVESPTASKFFSSKFAVSAASGQARSCSATASPVKTMPPAVAAPSPDHIGKPAKPSSAAIAPAAASNVWGSRSHVKESSTWSNAGRLRGSLDVPPLVEVVRTKYCHADDDSDDSDRELEEKLMLKYGLKR